MDHIELYSRISRLDTKVSDWVFKVWMAMFLGFYILALFGLCLIHRAYTDSLLEMRHELAARLSATPQAAPISKRGP